MIEKRKMPSVRSKEITYRLCKALKECLTNTPNLACLELQGLPLRERDLTTLMKVRIQISSQGYEPFTTIIIKVFFSFYYAKNDMLTFLGR